MNDSENGLSLEEVIADGLNALKMDTEAILRQLQTVSATKATNLPTEAEKALESTTRTLSSNLLTIYEKMKELPKSSELLQRLNRLQSENDTLQNEMHRHQRSAEARTGQAFKAELQDIREAIARYPVVRSDWRAWAFGFFCLVLAVAIASAKLIDREAIKTKADSEAFETEKAFVTSSFFMYSKKDWAEKETGNGEIVTLTKKTGKGK